MDKKQQFSLWYFVGTFFVIMLLQQLFFGPHAETLAYSDFKKLVAAGKVTEV
jgi:hypothetical protein